MALPLAMTSTPVISPTMVKPIQPLVYYCIQEQRGNSFDDFLSRQLGLVDDQLSRGFLGVRADSGRAPVPAGRRPWDRERQ